jgi:hypothetical protein
MMWFLACWMPGVCGSSKTDRHLSRVKMQVEEEMGVEGGGVVVLELLGTGQPVFLVQVIVDFKVEGK